MGAKACDLACFSSPTDVIYLDQISHVTQVVAGMSHRSGSSSRSVTQGGWPGLYRPLYSKPPTSRLQRNMGEGAVNAPKPPNTNKSREKQQEQADDKSNKKEPSEKITEERRQIKTRASV